MFSFDGDPEPISPEVLVVVRRFESPVEAQMAKGMLDSVGLECWLVGENVNSLLQAAFRVQIQVRAEDEAQARAMLEEGEERIA